MPSKKSKEPQRYVAVRQLIYPHVETGERVVIEPGEQVLNLAPESLALEIEAGNVRAEAAVDLTPLDEEKS